MQESRRIALPPGWSWLQSSESEALSNELQRELPAGHELHGRQFTALARCVGEDDVVFETRDGSRRIYLVRLTWTRESNPEWPSATEFESIEEFARLR